jgi:hypothetical protein
MGSPVTDLLILALLAAVILSPVALVFAIAHRFSGSFSVSGKLDDGRAVREARQEAERLRAIAETTPVITVEKRP